MPPDGVLDRQLVGRFRFRLAAYEIHVLRGDSQLGSFVSVLITVGWLGQTPDDNGLHPFAKVLGAGLAHSFAADGHIKEHGDKLAVFVLLLRITHLAEGGEAGTVMLAQRNIRSQAAGDSNPYNTHANFPLK